MKGLFRALALTILLTGVFAAAAYPSAPVNVTLFGTGSGPAPLCAPHQPNCNPGPMFPNGTNLAGTGSGPAPLCAPHQPKCNPGPMFPKGPNHER